jgi:hypothetical protein
VLGSADQSGVVKAEISREHKSQKQDLQSDRVSRDEHGGFAEKPMHDCLYTIRSKAGTSTGGRNARVQMTAPG